MKTKEEIISMLEREFGSWTAVRTADANGANENYGVCEISSLLDQDADCPTIYNYEYDGCELATPDKVDLDIWAQDFGDEIKDGLRDDLKNGDLYIARFHSEEYGDMELLIWE